MISLRYALTPEDFANFTVYVQLEAPGQKKAIYKSLRPLIIIMAIIVIANVATTIASGHPDSGNFIGVGIVLALLILPTLSLKPRLKKKALAFAANPENAAVFSMTDHIFSETGVLLKNDSSESKFQLKAFIKKQETAEYIYLFIQSNNALIIPKKVIR